MAARKRGRPAKTTTSEEHEAPTKKKTKTSGDAFAWTPRDEAALCL